MGIAPQDKGLATAVTSPAASAAQVWLLNDGRPGHHHQSRALAQALQSASVSLTALDVRWPPPWRWLAPRQPPGLGHWGRQLPVPRGPTLVIGCGRRCAQAALWLRRHYPQQVRTLQILDPRRQRDDFDVLIVPEHDAIAGANIVAITGSLHAITQQQLAAARRHWLPRWQHWPGPRLGILLGGGEATLFQRRWQAMYAVLQQRLVHGGSVLCSFSPRTPSTAVATVRADLSRWPGLCYSLPADRPIAPAGNPAEDNPYLGILACADELWLDGDSVNMVSEALACGRPVRVGDTALRPAHRRFHASLLRRGLITPLHSHAQPAHTAGQPLDTVLRELAARLPAAWLTHSAALHRGSSPPRCETLS